MVEAQRMCQRNMRVLSAFKLLKLLSDITSAVWASAASHLLHTEIKDTRTEFIKLIKYSSEGGPL